MRAAILADDRLEVMEIATPVPGPGEALLRVSACGVCHTDLHVMKGEVRFPRPAVLGHEVSGSIVAIGAGTTDARTLQVGDHVAAGFIMPCGTCAQCARDRDDLCTEFFLRNRLEGTLYDGTSRLAMPDGSFLAMYSMGGLAEYCVVPLTALTTLDGSLDIETSCILGCSGLTSYGAVFRAGEVSSGMSVAIVGVGGIGTSLIPMARAAGASAIVAVDIAPEKLDRARELGATDVVDASREDPVVRVRELTGGVDVAFEALGRPATFAQAVGMLADGGRMVAIGIAAGAATAEVEITPLVRRGQQIIGSFGARTRTDLPAVAALAASGAFDPGSLITRRYRLDEADEAYRALARGEITGRAIITMGASREAKEHE
jgi:S-(hydroxymethyl)glutathione dehydrogenase/alcohol dehydrogenase